jgi:hypothetical protein
MAGHNYTEFYKGIPSIGERPLVAQTCDACGLILGSKHYRRTHRNTWPRTCVTCVNRRYRETHPKLDDSQHAARRILQNESLDTATNNGKDWTFKDLDIIAEALKAGLKHREIAPLVNRTLFSTRAAILIYGLSNGWPSRDEWLIKFK